MATTVTKTIKPSGGDYTSLSAAEAGEQRDLVALNEISVLECYSMTDTAQVTIAGWTTDATHYIHIYTPTAERHAGKWDGTKYNISPSTNGNCIYVSGAGHVRIEGIQCSPVVPWVESRYGIYLQPTSEASPEYYLESCIIEGSRMDAGAFNVGIYFPWSSGNSGVPIIKVSNCLCYDIKGTTITAGFNFNSNTFAFLSYNNTAENCTYGFYGTDNYSAGPQKWKNCGASNCTSAFGGTGGTQTTCSSITPTFVDGAGNDFHLASSDTTWQNAGTDLSADADYPITTDIDGQTRTGLWDIGADEYVAAGNGALIPVSGGVAGISAFAGMSALAYGAAGSVAGLSVMNAMAGLSYNVTGSVAGNSLLSSGVAVQRDVSAAMNGVSSMSGAVITTVTTALAGSTVALTVLDGGVGITRSVSVISVGSSSLFASVGVLKGLQGATSGVSFLSASIAGQPVNYILGRIDALSTSAGGVAMGYGLSGSSLSALLLMGDIHEVYSSSGLVSGTSFVTASPVFSGQLSPNTLRGSPRFDVTRYGGGAPPTVHADSAAATVTQYNNNPKVTR